MVGARAAVAAARVCAVTGGMRARAGACTVTSLLPCAPMPRKRRLSCWRLTEVATGYSPLSHWHSQDVPLRSLVSAAPQRAGRGMRARGITVKVVSKMLGHSDVAITLRVYTYVNEEMQEQAARAMGQILFDQVVRSARTLWSDCGQFSGQQLTTHLPRGAQTRLAMGMLDARARICTRIAHSRACLPACERATRTHTVREPTRRTARRTARRVARG